MAAPETRNAQPDQRGVFEASLVEDACPAKCVLESLSARFFEDEPDPNREDKLRLDIKLSFADGRWVRYHPKAILIWSDEQLPSQAMRARYNRAAKLPKRGYRRQCTVLLPW